MTKKSTKKSTKKLRIIGVIPARIGSEEIHAKVLKDLGGKPVIAHVIQRVKDAKIFDEIIVGADHEKILEVARNEGVKAVMTRKDHVCGSDRVAEAAATVQGDIVVNIQADEPFLNPKMLPEVIQPLLDDPTLDMSTLCCKFLDKAASEYPFNVKMVKSQKSSLALYFSRSVMPYARKPNIVPTYQHIGVYAFRAKKLQEYASFGPSNLELIEGLEQLRALEHGFRIKVVESLQNYQRIAINTAQDLEQARKIMEVK